ncbi:MAG: thioredoxin [Rhodobacteraceae bacterium]|nr:thioredoxin [Paracoccaceae bacterium]
MRFLFTLVTAVFLGNIAAAATVGDDGLHIQPWIRDTFKDLQEDLDEANAEGKRLAIMFEQRGCIYCKEMHETVYTDPELAGYIDDNFFVVRLNLHGDLEVVDFDGDTGAFSRGMTLDMFTWVNEKRYALDSDEDFQRYHARRINERRAAKE